MRTLKSDSPSNDFNSTRKPRKESEENLDAGQFTIIALDVLVTSFKPSGI